MIRSNKQDLIGTLKITGVTQNVRLLPLVVPVKNTDKKHECNYVSLSSNHHQSLSVLYLSEQDIGTKIPLIADRFDQIPQRYPGIDENITTMVQMSSERDTCTDAGKNWTDEEKLRLNQSCEQMKEEEKGVRNTVALIDESSTLSFRINEVPFIEISGLIMASWTDVKELLFPRCSAPNCCVVLHCLIKKFAYPSNLRLMHPCTDKEESLFLRQFKLVFRGCILISLPEVDKHMFELQDAVERIHHNRRKTDICCKYQEAKFARCSSQRPKTSNPRQRSIFARRPKSAIETTTSECRQKLQRFTILPILHLPDDIQETMATPTSSLGPEVDAEDCHLPVLISTGDGNLTVPCTVLTRVFPQTYNVVIDSLATQHTTTNQDQIPYKTKDNTSQNQITYSACSTLQAAAFSHWILKYAGCTMKAITTGGLMINLRCFSMLTNGILPLETRKVLQATCQWQKEEDVCPTNDLPVQNNLNENIENDVHVDEYNVAIDSTVDPSVRASDLFDSNHNAGELQDDETEDQPQDIDVVPQDNEMQCVGNNIYQSGDRQQFYSTDAQRKGQLRVKRASSRVNTTTVSITTQGGKSSFSVSTSQISSKKMPRQKSARRGSKCGPAKSPYLVQSALLNQGRVVKHYKRTPSSANSVDVRSENEMDISSRHRCHMSANISKKLELWPKAFIAKPPSVLRVNSSPKESRVSSPRNPQFHPTCTVDHSGFEPCSRQAKQKNMEHSLTVNSNSLEKRKLFRMRVTGAVCPERHKGKPNLKLGRQIRNQSSSDSVLGKDSNSILHSYSSSFDGTDMNHPSLASLSEDCHHEHLQSDSLEMAAVHTLEQQPIKIPSENDYSEDEHICDGGKLSTVEEEALTTTSQKSDVIQSSTKSGIYQPIPPWKMYNLQINDHHPYTDIYKMYSVPPQSPTVHQKKDRDRLEAWDFNCGDGSLSASSSIYTETSSCSTKLNQESNQLHDQESGLQGTNKDIPSPETSLQEVKNSSKDSHSGSYYSSEEFKTSAILYSEDDISTTDEPFPLKVVGLINALQTLQISTPRNPLIGNLLRENVTPMSHVDTSVISATSDLIKPNNLRHQKAANYPSSLASSDTTVPSDQLSTSSDQRSVDLCDNSSTSEDIKCPSATSQTNGFITTENSNEENISGDEGKIHSDYTEIASPILIKVSPKISKIHSGVIGPAPYKGSALILAEDTPESNKLQEILSRQKILHGMKSLITPDLLNISRFKSIGNVLITKQKDNATYEKPQNKLTESAIGGKEKDGMTLVVSKPKQIQQQLPEKRLEHIKINSSIELRQQRLDNKYTDTGLTNDVLNSIAKSNTDDALHQKTDDVINPNDTTVRPIRMQYDVTSTRPTGTGHFQHYRQTSPIMVRKGINVKQNAPVANNHFSSSKEGCNKIHDHEELFQGMVTNSSIRYQALSRAQDYIAKFPLDTCYKIPSSSPNISYRSSQQPVCNTQSCDGSKRVSCTQSTEGIPHLNACSRPRHRLSQCVRDEQYCVECLEKRQKPAFKYTSRTPGLQIPQQLNSMNMAPNSPLQIHPIPGTRDEEECCSVYHVHDSINKPLNALKYRRISNVNTDLPKRNLAEMSIENINKLEDNISIISLGSPNEYCSNAVKSSTGTGETNGDATDPNEQPKLSSKTTHKTTTTTTNLQGTTATSKVNVVFEYKHQPENRVSTPSIPSKFIATTYRGQNENARVCFSSIPKGYDKVCDSRHSKPARHLTGNIKRKLRICIDLVGSSEEDNPLEVRKLESRYVDSTNVSK